MSLAKRTCRDSACTSTEGANYQRPQMLAARSRRASTFCLAPRFIQLYLREVTPWRTRDSGSVAEGRESVNDKLPAMELVGRLISKLHKRSQLAD